MTLPNDKAFGTTPSLQQSDIDDFDSLIVGHVEKLILVRQVKEREAEVEHLLFGWMLWKSISFNTPAAMGAQSLDRLERQTSLPDQFSVVATLDHEETTRKNKIL